MVIRITTGIKGLDELVEGGYPEGSIILVSGPSGAGKSLFSLSFLIEGEAESTPTLYITIEEPRSSLIEGAKGIGLRIEEKISNDGLLISDLTPVSMLDNDDDTGPGLSSFSSVVDIIRKEVERLGIKRVVVDSLTAIGIHYTDEGKFRQELFRFCQQLRSFGVTTVLVGESLEGVRSTRFGVEEFLCDGFIMLELQKIEGELRRTINVRKMRFTKHDSAVHPVLILRTGIRVSTREKVY